MSDVFGVVLRCQKVEAGRRGRKSSASCSAATWWLAAGLEGVCCGKHTEIWSGRWNGYRIEIFFELDAVI